MIYGGRARRLAIDANGSIDTTYSTLTVNGGQRSGNVDTDGDGIFSVDDIGTSDTGDVYFNADGSIKNKANPDTNIDGGTFTFQGTLPRLDIINNSDIDMVINDIETVSSGGTPLVQLDAANVSLDFYIDQSPAPTEVSILNAGDSDIVLNGEINNPVGSTLISNTLGNLLSTGPQAIIRSNLLDVQLAAGSMGAADQRVNVELVQSIDTFGNTRSVGFSSTAGDDVRLNLTTLLRNDALVVTTPGDLMIDVDAITAGGDIDLLVRDNIRQTIGGSSATSGIRVEGSTIANAVRYTHFQLETGGARFLDQGAFAGTDNGILEATYRFNDHTNAGLTVGGDLTIAAASGSSRIDIHAVTDLLGEGGLNVDTVGVVSVTELNGDMRVGLIRSGDDDVTLVSPGSIVDADDDETADISGNALNLMATVTVGTQDNAVEIDSSSLTAMAEGSIFLDEVSGDLNLNRVVSTTGDVILQAAGSILDGNDTIDSNIDAVHISLTATTGGIGGAVNDLDVDSSASGRVDVLAAEGIYLREFSGAMIAGSVVSTNGDIRLTVSETAASGEDLIVLEQVETSGGSVALLVGDNVYLEASAADHALNTVSILGDFGNMDSGLGTIVHLQGAVTGDLVTMHGDERSRRIRTDQCYFFHGG